MAIGDIDTTTISASEAALTLYSEAEINAPASLVFETFINTSTWPKWNSFVPQVNMLKHALDDNSQNTGMTINNAQVVNTPAGVQVQAMSQTLEKGTIMQFTNATQKSGLSSFFTYLCYDIDCESRSAAWVYDSDMNPYPKALLQIERTTEVEDLGNGKCKILMLERQKGPKASYVKLRSGSSLKKGFETQAQGLKKYIESMDTKDQS